jgi:hypothetical protein
LRFSVICSASGLTAGPWGNFVAHVDGDLVRTSLRLARFAIAHDRRDLFCTSRYFSEPIDALPGDSGHDILPFPVHPTARAARCQKRVGQKRMDESAASRSAMTQSIFKFGISPGGTDLKI